MGRTVPSFRIVLEEEKQEWKPFRNALDKSERKSFDEMWDIPRLYITTCSNSVQLVPLHPIIMSILFHHYKELIECIKEVEQIREARAASSKNRRKGSTKREEKREEEKSEAINQTRHTDNIVVPVQEVSNKSKKKKSPTAKKEEPILDSYFTKSKIKTIEIK